MKNRTKRRTKKPRWGFLILDHGRRWANNDPFGIGFNSDSRPPKQKSVSINKNIQYPLN